MNSQHVQHQVVKEEWQFSVSLTLLIAFMCAMQLVLLVQATCATVQALVARSGR
jgi:hypothetical protein